MRPARSLATLAFLLGFLGAAVSLGVFPGILGAREASFEDQLRKGLGDKAADFWIYDDMQAAHAQAQTTGKPLLVTVRCIP